MTKSMHVGSLAFAVEGQVQEKTRWFQSLEETNKKVKMLKTEHAKLSEMALEYKESLADMTQLAKTIQPTVDHHAQLERDYKDIKFKYAKETKERKGLYNQIVEMKGNIRVFCRCRPLNLEEIEAGATMAFDFESAKEGEVALKSSHGSFKKIYKFDSVFGPEDNQGISRESFTVDVNAMDYGFEPTDTPRTDRSVLKNIELGIAAISGEKGAAYDRIVLNAGMVDHLLGCCGAENIHSAFERAREAIDSGKALERLMNYIKMSHKV